MGRHVGSGCYRRENGFHNCSPMKLTYCIWIIQQLMAYGPMTFAQLSKRWLEDNVADGKVLQRSSFNRHRDTILNMFGIIIDCEELTYRYYISNPSALQDDSIERWLFSTLTVHGVLTDGASVKERVVLENVPAGEEYLDTIIQSMKTNHRLHMGYKKFGKEGYVKTVCPYALKLFHQRWYMLARNDEDQMRVYAFDRMHGVRLTDEDFVMPEDFSAQAYFAEYFGVLTDRTPMTHVVVRAHRWTPDYLRTLPLHHSQRELKRDTADGVAHTDDTGQDEQCNYTDFSFDIRPTADFLGQLLSHGDGIEVLEPLELRQKMREMIASSLKRYE